MTEELDIDILARTLWGEARGEGLTGMEAVALSILNRLAVSKQEGDYWWGNSISDICQKSYQFSCWNLYYSNHKKLLKLTPHDKLFKVALEIAEDAIAGLLFHDMTNGATHYHKAGLTPYWSKGEKHIAVIGRHVFYRIKEVPVLVQKRPFLTFAESRTSPHNDSVDDDNYVLSHDWDYIYDDNGTFRKNHYKKGIFYDSASVPNLLGAIVDLHPNGPLRPSSLPHDILFIYQGRDFPKGMQFVWDDEKWIDDDKEWTRRQADKLFKRINYEYGRIPKWKTRLSYRVLTLGSWFAWRSDDVESRKQIDALYN